MVRLKRLVIVAGLLFSSAALANQSFMCNIVKFTAGGSSEINSLTAPQPSIVIIQDKTIMVDSQIFKKVNPRDFGINLKVITGFDYFHNRRIYQLTNKRNTTVFVSQPYDLENKLVIPEDQIVYSDCTQINGGTLGE